MLVVLGQCHLITGRGGEWLARRGAGGEGGALRDTAGFGGNRDYFKHQ